MRTTATMIKVATSLESRPKRRVRYRIQFKGIGIESSICITEPAPTTGNPRRNLRMKRRKRLGGDVDFGLVALRKEEPSIWPSVRRRTVALTRFRKISTGVKTKCDSGSESDKREEVMNEEQRTRMVKKMADTAPTTTKRLFST